MAVEQLLTADDLWAMPEAPGKQFELVNGKLVEMAGTGGEHGLIVGVVFSIIRAFVTARNLGVVFGDKVSYILGRDPDLVRIPDTSYVLWARVPEGGIPRGFLPFAPDLAVEVVSPHDLAQEVHEKVHEYLDGGATMAWVLWPEERSVTVYGPGGQIRELGADDILEGGDVLPGFRTAVSALFEIPVRPQR